MQGDAFPTVLRRALLAAAAFALVAGVWVGLVRLGWAIAPPPLALASAHGALMIHGLFGTLIGVERAVALERKWAFASPAASALGVVLLALGVGGAATLAFVVGAFVLVVASVVVLHKQPHAFTALLALAALALFGASVALATGAPPFVLVPAWMTFLVVTIAAERLELARMRQPPRRAVVLLVAIAAGAFVTAAATLRWLDAARAFGVSALLLAAWLARFDLARRTIRFPGLPRFVASALLAGYAWLAFGGVLLARYGLVPGSLGYDAALHAVFVGFVLSMVFAHAPIVLPAVARVRLPFRPTFYGPLLLLHASLAVRVIGDLTERLELRRAGGLGHAFALALFALSLVGSHRRALPLEEAHAASSR